MRWGRFSSVLCVVDQLDLHLLGTDNMPDVWDAMTCMFIIRAPYGNLANRQS